MNKPLTAIWHWPLAVGVGLMAPQAIAADGFVDEIVVVAGREPLPSFRLPVSVHVVHRDTMLERQYRTLPQALRDLPGVMVQETAFGQGSPYLRGFTGFRNVFLVDGVRLNNSVFRDGPNQYWATVDLYGLDRIEVLKGPASTLYGSDAVGGTVNAMTEDPFTAASRALLRLSSAEESVTGRVQAAGRLGERTAGSLGITGKSYGDLEGGEKVGKQTGVGYDEHAVDLKLSRHLTEAWRVDALFQEVRQNNVPRTHRTVDAVAWHGVEAGSELARELDQERGLAYVRLANESLEGPVQGLSLTAAYATMDETRDRLRTGNRRDKQGFSVDTLGLLVQARSETAVGTLTYGIDYYRDEVDSFSSSNPVQGPVADDASYESIDVYLQDRISVAERVDLTLGLRHTSADADADSVLDTVSGTVTGIGGEWSATVASVGASWAAVPDRLAVFGNLSQGFRAPNLSDLTRLDTARSNEFEVPTPGLEDEQFLSVETGIKLRHAGGSLQLAYFHTDIEDLIQRVPTGRVFDGQFEVSKANVGDGKVEGIELSWNRRVIERLGVFAAVTWMDGEAETFPTSEPVAVSEPLDRLMPLTATVGARWSSAGNRYWLEGVLTGAEGQDELSTRDAGDTTRIPPGGTPGYVVAHLRGGYRFGARLQATLGVDNLLDKDYRIHGSGTNMPGRNFMVTLESRL